MDCCLFKERHTSQWSYGLDIYPAIGLYLWLMPKLDGYFVILCILCPYISLQVIKKNRRVTCEVEKTFLMSTPVILCTTINDHSATTTLSTLWLISSFFNRTYESSIMSFYHSLFLTHHHKARHNLPGRDDQARWHIGINYHSTQPPSPPPFVKPPKLN